MNFLKQIWFLAAIFVAVGNELVSSAPSQSFETAYMTGKQHRAYEETKNYIQELSSQGKDPRTNEIMLNGFMEMIDFINSASNAAYDSLKSAQDSVNNTTPEVIVEIVKTGFSKANADIISSGASAYLTLGKLTELTNATQGLNNATQTITHNAEVSFGGLNSARDITIKGIESGGAALPGGLLAGVKAVTAAEEAILNVVKKAAKQTYDALSEGPMPVNPETQLMKDEAAQSLPECLNAIKSIQESATEHLNELTSDNKRYAIEVIRDGLIEGLKTIATAKPIFTEVNESFTMENKKSAISLLTESFDDCKKTLVVAIAECQQTLGRLSEILGSEYKDPIIQAMLLTEAGRAATNEVLAKSLLIAVHGIENDNSDSAMAATLDGVETAGFSSYAQIVKSAKHAMNTVVLSK